MDRHHDPAHDTRLDEQLADRLAIPGAARPTLWRAPVAQQPGCLSQQLARLLLDGLTQVGDVVLDVDDDVPFAATAARMGRRHHALDGEHHLASMSHAAGDIDLILLHWPRPPVNPHWLLRACRALLGATGSLAVAVHADGGQRVARLSALLGAATTVGLRTVQHVAVLDPAAATPVATSDGPRGRQEERRTTSTAKQANAGEIPDPHTDLLIFEPEADGNE